MGQPVYQKVFSPPPPGMASTSNEANVVATFDNLASHFTGPQVFFPLNRRVESNPAEENMGRVTYSSPEREAESQRLLEQVRNIQSIAEVVPIFRRVMELEDEERIDRRKRERETRRALVSALAECEADLATRGRRLSDLVPVWPTMDDLTNTSDATASSLNQEVDLFWPDDDSFDFGDPPTYEDSTADAQGNGVVFQLPLMFTVPIASGNESDTEWSSDDSDSSPESSPRRPAPPASRSSLGSH